MHNVVLVGFRGCGKTTFGRKLAQVSGQPFADLDEQIEFFLGESIYDFVDKHGWQEFRAVEQKVTHDFCRNYSGILATGGGTLENSKNLQNLKKSGKFVFLNPDFQSEKQYLLKDGTRPRLNTEISHEEEIDLAWNQRKDIYSAIADVEVAPDMEASVDQEIKKITNQLPSNFLPPQPPHKRVAILASTNGSSFQGVLDAQKIGRIPNAEFTLFVTNKPNCNALEKAKKANIPNIEVFASEKGETKEEYDRQLINMLRIHKPDAILLVGWMKVLSKLFCDQFGKITYNTHPSLLPKYAGMMGDKIHEQVLEDEEKYAGCTIHRVSDELDGGEIVLQRKVLVDSEDSVESLRLKVQKQEMLGFCELLERR